MASLDHSISLLQRLKNFALNAGAISIECCTSEGAHRAEAAVLLREFIGGYSEVLQNLLALPEVTHLSDKSEPLMTILTQLDRHLSAFNSAGDYASLSPEDAGKTVRMIRTDVMPAALSLQSQLRKLQKEQQDRETEAMGEKADALETMFTEVEQIGRMIHLISLNASVEAARAGGESGRSFKVIADEIRVLATRSAQLIESTRDTLAGHTIHELERYQKAG